MSYKPNVNQDYVFQEFWKSYEDNGVKMFSN